MAFQAPLSQLLLTGPPLPSCLQRDPLRQLRPTNTPPHPRRTQMRQRKTQIQRLNITLMWLMHAQSCTAAPGRCAQDSSHCAEAKQLLAHINQCTLHSKCARKNCVSARWALQHFQKCNNQSCQICSGALQMLRQRKAIAQDAQGQGPTKSTESGKRRGEDEGSAGNLHHSKAARVGQRNGAATAVDEADRTSPSSYVPPGSAALQTAHMPNRDSTLAHKPLDTADDASEQSEGSCLMETFSAEDIRKHLHRIKRAAETQQEQACQPSGREQQEVDWQSHCLACGMGSVKFEPPPLYCFHCNQRIKKNQRYYELMMTAAGTRHYFCQECLNKIPGDHVEVENLRVNKNELKAQVNQQNQEESWVECSECGYWLHQICVLFNHRINAANSKFTCPFCMLKELESGKRRPASVDERSRSQWPASKLPTTRLSDYLEQWLNDATKNERLERAREAGLPPDRVEKAGELTVRVVCSRNKTLNTKLHFQKSFERYYPRSFRYRSKAILLFQRIDGVDVCLFAMYVQEYGADQARPNNRRVYISYLDSVKYFEPEVKTRDRDALRTYVYHHLIIAYLKHCKERGFVTCNIWACPPPKGENYIFYCHPNKQKVPSNEKLREWYHKLLQRARKYNVVVHVDNMYDKFNMGDLEQVHSATHLPYFEGDFFSTIAEKKLEEIQSEGSSGKVPRSISKQGSNRRGVKVNPWLKGDKIKDGSLMNKLGEAIRDTKADFMLVYLQHECSECMRPIGGMDRFYPPTPHNQQGTSSLPSGGINYCADCIASHEDLQSQMIRDTVPPLPDTSDKDPDIVNEFFDTRLDFLKLCMWHLFQFDTLRRAKHSSMMVLYYLHNPEGTAWFTCNLCNQTIEPGTGARCTVCTDFDVCGNCYATCSHEHPLDLARGDGGQAKQSNRTQEIIAVIQHAFQCNLRRCGVEKCTRVKNVFIHAYKGCSTKAINGCKTCKEYDQLLQLHVRSCNNDNCLLPGCQQQKHFRRQAQANEDQRRMQQYQEQVVAAAE